jgi:hypothetical protein
LAGLTDVARMVQHFAGCSPDAATRAATAICADPEAYNLLLTTAAKCGVATAGVAAGGMLFVSGMSPISAPNLAAGALVAAVSMNRAVTFCSRMVELGTSLVPPELKEQLAD